MKILLHICCAPCAIFPLKVLREQENEVCGLFFNPNIHPYKEYEKRRETLRSCAEAMDFKAFFPDHYPMEEFLRGVAYRESQRCRICYYQRLSYTAAFARQNGFVAFSTTLLYSVYQKHEIIRQIGREVADEAGIPFHYQDFRNGWREGVEISRKMDLYRQKYCGCIYSEKERYLKT